MTDTGTLLRGLLTAGGLGMLLCLAPGGTALAQDGGGYDPVYEVHDLVVDETAGSETAAKAAGLASAKRRALREVLSRLLPDGRAALFPELPPAELENLIHGFWLTDEKFSRGQGRYLARVNVRFRQDAVRGLLRGRGIPHAETAAAPALVLPLLRTGGRVLLWEEDNPWMRAWAARPPRPSLTPLRLPLGDIADITGFPPSALLQTGPQHRINLARKYGARHVLLAVAEVVNGAEGRPPRIVVKLVMEGPGWRGFSRQIDVRGEAGEPLDKLLEAAVAQSVIPAEEDWKRRLAMDFQPPVRQVSVYLPLRGLRNWIDLQRLLAEEPALDSVTLRELSVSRALLTLSHWGASGQLDLALMQHGLQLTLSPENPYYVLQQEDPPAAGTPG